MQWRCSSYLEFAERNPIRTVARERGRATAPHRAHPALCGTDRLIRPTTLSAEGPTASRTTSVPTYRHALFLRTCPRIRPDQLPSKADSVRSFRMGASQYAAGAKSVVLLAGKVASGRRSPVVGAAHPPNCASPRHFAAWATFENNRTSH